jgi:hypothetical protein
MKTTMIAVATRQRAMNRSSRAVKSRSAIAPSRKPYFPGIITPAGVARTTHARKIRRPGISKRRAAGPPHRFDAAAFAAGGKGCNPRILGIGADSGHHEHRSPNTRVATDASG